MLWQVSISHGNGATRTTKVQAGKIRSMSNERLRRPTSLEGCREAKSAGLVKRILRYRVSKEEELFIRGRLLSRSALYFPKRNATSGSNLPYRIQQGW